MIWFNAAEVAKLYKVSPGYVRKIACAQQWRRRKQGTRTYYLHDDIAAWHHDRPAQVLDRLTTMGHA